MPSTYAHYRLGNEAMKLLPENIKKIVSENYESYALGLHGPDLLFYFKPLTVNEINAKGYAIHEQHAAEFFGAAKEVYLKRGMRAADEAYLLGFLCHFALDSQAHPIVNAEMKSKNLTHTEIESAFDKYLLENDGKNPFKTDLTAHILNGAKTRDIAAAYFSVTEKQAEKAIKSIKFYNKLMRAHNPAARGLITLILKVSGMWENVHGMILPLKTDERYNDGIRGLTEAYVQAVKKADELIVNYHSFLRGESALSDKLNRDFE